MRRDWNNPLFDSDLEDAEPAATTLASVAEPRFLNAIQEALLSLTDNGEKVCIATHRGKYDSDGNRVDGEQDAIGEFRTLGYEFQQAEYTWEVEREPELYGCAASQMWAMELAMQLTPDLIRSLLDLKVILDRFGGQAWIAPHVRDETVVGYAFIWSHVSKLARGKEPDADIATPLPLVLAGEEPREPAPEPVATQNGSDGTG